MVRHARPSSQQQVQAQFEASIFVDDIKNTIPEDPRNRWAAERTLLAWLRTSLALMGFGFVVARFGFFLRQLVMVSESLAPPKTGSSISIGVALVVLGVVICLLAALEHARIIGRMNRGEPFIPQRWSLGIIFAMFLAAIGAGMALYLLSLS
jgi:putative membrane protein